LEQDIPARAPQPVGAGPITRRLLSGLLLSVGAFAIAFRGAGLAGINDTVVAIVGASGVALVIAIAVTWRTVGPLTRAQRELQERYETALADALRDPLTGLGNHRAFQEELDRQVAAAQRYGMPLALILLDLDEFKAINDGFGHARGDRVLGGFGRLLNGTVRRADRPFRIGGDEFAVILPHTDADGAVVVARRLLAEGLEPSLGGEDVEAISFSAGVTAMPELAATREDLYAQADAALYAAKRSGRTDVALFDPEIVPAASHSPDLAAAVANIIARGALTPVYQPIVGLVSRKVIGVEGLIRPQAPSPFPNAAAMFAAAASSGRITALDLACVDVVVAGATALPPDQFLTINLSPATIETPEFGSGALLTILARHEFSPHRLVVELTEHESITDPERVRSRLDACRRAGIRFAADDVGAGNAGLRLLAEIPFEIVKVDLGLVQRSAASGPSSAVLGSIVDLASRMGAFVIAEGIEHAWQIGQLTALGIDAGQGFYLGRPGPILVAYAAPSEPVPVLESDAGSVGVNAWRQSIGLTSTG
jgi:diguanylate cyclase (GGDEF)-like protein